VDPLLTAPVAAELMDLVELVRRLRADCPWDAKQTHASLTRHLLEESYEAIDAIEELTRAEAGEGDEAVAVTHLEEELGDVLFQVVFHATLASEEGRFTLADVARGVHDKLVSRHPHVFGDVVADSPEAVVANWEVIKQAEKQRESVTDGIPLALPALALATKLQRKASAVGVSADGAGDDATQWRALVEALTSLPSSQGSGQHSRRTRSRSTQLPPAPTASCCSRSPTSAVGGASTPREHCARQRCGCATRSSRPNSAGDPSPTNRHAPLFAGPSLVALEWWYLAREAPRSGT